MHLRQTMVQVTVMHLRQTVVQAAVMHLRQTVVQATVMHLRQTAVQTAAPPTTTVVLPMTAVLQATAMIRQAPEE